MSPAKITLLGLALILAATLFPYDFSSSEFVNLSQSFGLSRTIARRGNDLLIGIDAASGQPFNGRIDELRIYSRALTAGEIAQAAIMKPPVTNLAAYYSFDEASGAIAEDRSGHSNNGVLVNDPEWIIGKSGHGLRFNGSNQYARIPNTPSIDISDENITISMWVVLQKSMDRRDQVILGKPWHPRSMVYPYYQYGVEFTNRTRTLDFYFGDTSGRLRGPFSLKPQTKVWTHAAFTYDGKVVRGYIDGREQFSRGLGEPFDLPDLAVNLLLFAPFGFGLAGLIQNRGWSCGKAIASVFVAGALLSLGVETLQCWLPTRDPSFLDVATNSVSSVIGAALYFLGGERFRARHARPAFSTRMLVTAWLGYAALAVVLSLTLQESSRLDWDEGLPLILGDDSASDRQWQGQILRTEISSGSVSVNEARHASIAGLSGVGEAYFVATSPASQSNLRTDDSVERATRAERVSNVVRRVKRANQFSLLVRCSAQNAAQSGVIVALARREDDLNFALEQDDTDLTFWLRTPITRRHGMQPPVTAPGVFRTPGPHTILVTYDGSQLLLFVDGKPVDESLRLGPGAAMFSYFQVLKVEEMRGYQVFYYLIVLGPLSWITGLFLTKARRLSS
jgi:VanZ family protein